MKKKNCFEYIFIILITYTTEKHISEMRQCDIYIPDYNLIVELDGSYHNVINKLNHRMKTHCRSTVKQY